MPSYCCKKSLSIVYVEVNVQILSILFGFLSNYWLEWIIGFRTMVDGVRI